jgi:hypothetical protein
MCQDKRPNTEAEARAFSPKVSAAMIGFQNAWAEMI